jgi:hypothetical protein
MALKHVFVLRVALALTLLAVGAAAWFAWQVSAPGSAPSHGLESDPTAAALFDSECAQCHTLAEVRAMLRRDAGAPTAAAAVCDFLADHGSTDAAQDARLAAYLTTDAP